MNLRAVTRAVFPFVALVIIACSSKSSTGTGTPPPDVTGGVPLLGADCDPIAPSRCGFPFPSNVYMVDDATTPTGKHVAFGATTLPQWSAGHYNDPKSWADHDGFSPGTAPMTHMPDATITGLPTQENMALSIGPDSPTILMEADTGKRVPHFAELDMSRGFDDTRTLMIRPAIRLKDATRYLVAIRHVVDMAGKALPPSPVFQALRDGTASDDVSVARRTTLYADIFDRLGKAGIAKTDLQIAWDYTTASRDNNTRALIHMRDDALAKVGADGPPYVIKEIVDNPNPHIRKRITATMTVPLYLDKPDAGAKLVLGDDGLPKQNGTAEFDVLIHVPVSIADGTKPAGAPLQNGHGLLGRKTEGQNGYLAEIADVYGYVAFGVDMVGMAEDDVGYITNTLVGDAAGFKNAIDRQHQGLLNSLLAMRMMKGRFVNEPAIQFNGKSAIDPTHAYYRGDSQGGIFGTTYMAITTDVTRGLLGEPGAPYTLLLNRSVDFAGFGTLLAIVYKDARDGQVAFGLIQMLWDRTEPDGYLPYIRENMLPNTPAHEVLLHVAIGDHQVSPLGAHLIARSIGAKNLSPVNRSIFGIEEQAAPITGSAMVEYDFGLPASPMTNIPPTGADNDDPHDKVRVLQSAEAQSDKFFRDGIVTDFCGGACKGK